MHPEGTKPVENPPETQNLKNRLFEKKNLQDEWNSIPKHVESVFRPSWLIFDPENSNFHDQGLQNRHFRADFQRFSAEKSSKNPK